MKKFIIPLQILYYVLYAAVFYLFVLFSGWLLDSSDLTALSDVMGAVFVILFIGVPAAVIVLARFSLIKWYVDPFAALIVPIYMYVGMIGTNMDRGNSLSAAFSLTNDSLVKDNGSGLLFFLGLFVLGILASFSVKRVREENISYCILRYASKRTK